MDAAERKQIEDRLSVVERDLARAERGEQGSDRSMSATLTDERNQLRGRLARFGRAADGTVDPSVIGAANDA